MLGLLKQLDQKKFLRGRLYLSFVLLGLTMVWPAGQWLAFVALIPLLSYLPSISSRPAKQVVLDFYFSGVILCGFANLFLFQVAPENWTIQLHGWFGIVSRLMSWVMISFLTALVYGLLGLILAKIKSNTNRILLLPLLFPLTEFLRSYWYAVAAYGPNGNFSPNFNWGSMAIPVSGTPLVYNSRWLGFFGLTLIAVVVNICLYLMVFKRRLLVPIALLCLILASTLLSWSVGNDLSGRTIKVASMHLNEESDMTLITPSLWPPEGTDLLVLPEYSGILKYKDYKKMLKRLSKDGIAITSIDNGRSPTGTNRIIVLNRDGYVVSSEDKTFLIPTGEYIPYALQLGFRLIGKSQALVDFRYSQQLTKGRHAETPIITHNGLTVGALACSGVGSLNGYRTLSRDGSDILTNSASLAFLLPNSIYHTYARNMARFQAVSNNKAFIQASRSGQSYIIDNQGSFIARSSSQQDQLLTAEIQLSN